MRSTIEPRLRRIWRGEATPGDRLLRLVASPPSILFGLSVSLWGRMYNAGLRRVDRGEVPVVSVGNLAVGGTGKTPVSAWLVRALSERGWRPALVSRGYGEDEIRLHRRWNPGTPTIVAPRRIDGVREAAGTECDIVILDDGFQHRALHRDFDLLLLSPAHHFPGRLLPAGPYRESPEALRRADRILVTAKGGDESEAGDLLLEKIRGIRGVPPVDLFLLEAGAWETVDGSPTSPPPGNPLVVTSIAEPDSFLRLVLRRTGGIRGHLAYPDHHGFSEADVRRIRDEAAGSWIATTEKDAVKLIAFGELLPELRVLPLVASPSPELAGDLLMEIESRCGKVRDQ